MENALEKVAEMVVQFDSATKTMNFEPKDLGFRKFTSA